MHDMSKETATMQNWRSEPEQITAERMILQLAGVCNGAATWDSCGFSKMDVSFGHSLAQRAQQGRAWSVKQASAALKLIQKYSRQLGGKDAVRDWMQAPNFAMLPQEAAVKAADRKLFSQDQLAVFRFTYAPELVNVIKQIRGEHKGKRFGARWDAANKCWFVDVNETSIFQIIQVARDWEFEIEERFESYYTRVQQKLEGVREAAHESGVITALGYDAGVRVDSDQIVITHTDPKVLAEFQTMLSKV
jgi:hypothetical protein